MTILAPLLFHKKREATFIFLFLAAAGIFSAQENTGSGIPGRKIVELDSSTFTVIEEPAFLPGNSERAKKSNKIWRQYQRDIETYSKLKNIRGREARADELPESFFYMYTVKNSGNNYLTTFNGIYARFQTKQGTLATVNRISSPEEIAAGKRLILPIPQGLFIPKSGRTPLETLLQKEYHEEISSASIIYSIDGEQFCFLPDKNFSGTDISFFHDSGMRLPLSTKILTSPFGYRTSPISGKWTFHAGIDLAAPQGTDVLACKSGTVSTTGYNGTYGNYIILLHSGKKTSLYAHLSEILVRKGEIVSTGQTIGLVGTTGASTGPHLHFEVRENGNPEDPGKLIK